MVGTVIERGHTPLSVLFWTAYLVTSQAPDISAVQLQRQLNLKCYGMAFGILYKLRAGMVRLDQDRIGGQPGTHVEVDESWIGGKTRGAECVNDFETRTGYNFKSAIDCYHAFTRFG